jgi:hypothetical protein
MPIAINGTGTISGVSAGGLTSASNGRILQVVQAVLLSRVATTSATFSDTGITASITPSSASNKILVSVCMGGIGAAGSGGVLGTKLLRGATEILLGNASGSAIRVSAGTGGFGDANSTNGPIVIEYLDSPATTSSTTYKIQFASTYNSNQVVIGGSNNTGGVFNLTTPSTITLMEVAA